MRGLEKPGIEFDIRSGFLGQVNSHGNVFALRRYFNERHKFYLTPDSGLVVRLIED